MEKLVRFFKEEDGASAVEYALLVAAIALVIIGAVFYLGRVTNESLQNTAAGIDAGDPGTTTTP